MSLPSQRSFYDVLEVLVPGGFFSAMLLMLYHHPAATNLGEWSLGALGVFLIASFAIGHLVQTLSNMIEMGWWRWKGGMPVDWVRSGRGNLLSEQKVRELEAHVRIKLRQGSNFKLKELDGGTWYYLVRQMHALVIDGRSTQRIVHLDACYAINRGLACAVFALSVLFLLNNPFQESAQFDFNLICLGLVIVFTGILTLGRMERFCVQYALELFVQFVLLPLPQGQIDQSHAKTPTEELSA